jgi:hypothetical protein
MRAQQQFMEEKVNRIWTVLSAFEESAAACISDMLLHCSNQSHVDAVTEAGNFILHVEVLFQGIDDLEAVCIRNNETIGLLHNREPRMLAKKTVTFFSLLSHTQSTAGRQFGSVTQELLSLVTSLAQYLKILIRVALASALKLERKYGEKTAIGDFLSKLADVGNTIQAAEFANGQQLRLDQRFGLSDLDVNSDLCQSCRGSIEDSCVQFQNMRWHWKCCVCSKCRKELMQDVQSTSFDTVDHQMLCTACTKPSAVQGFVKITQLSQYTFLLRVALKRLISLLKVRGKLCKLVEISHVNFR